jgi:hypothetical protein
MATRMLWKVIVGNLAPYQMVQFLVKFDVKDLSIWFDPIFDQTKQLLQNMENIINCIAKNNNFMNTNAAMKILTFKMKNSTNTTSSKAKKIVASISMSPCLSHYVHSEQ